MKVINALDIIGGNPLFLHLLTIIGHIIPNMLYLLYKSFALQSFHLLPIHTLDLFIPILSHRFCLLT